MSIETAAKKEWTKPELVRLGTIGDVAGSGNGTNQCTTNSGGQTVCKS